MSYKRYDFLVLGLPASLNLLWQRYVSALPPFTRCHRLDSSLHSYCDDYIQVPLDQSDPCVVPRVSPIQWCLRTESRYEKG